MSEDKDTRKHTEWLAQQLKEKEAIIDGISDVLMVLDTKTYKILEVNHAFLNSFGVSRQEVLGKSCYDITHQLTIPCHKANSHCPCPLEDTASSGNASQAEHIHRDHEGNILYFEIITYPLRDASGRLTRIIHLSRDITLQKRLENEYHQLVLRTEKLSALGRMAAGIAHEINNPLTGILLYSSNLIKKVSAEGPLKKGLAVIIGEVQRCKGIVQNLLEFSRDKKPESVLANINEIIEKALNVLENEFRLHHISVEKDLSGDMPDNLLALNQMQQVFVNLLLNAVEAIQGKGKITVRSHVDPGQTRQRVEISDTGCGIPQESMNKIFDPFFSTKESGTGLGLAVSYGIIQQHGGHIQVSSRPGEGTRFTIEIPLLHPRKKAMVMEPIKVLLVDDEKDFVGTLSARIKKRRFEAEIAFNGGQALELVNNQVPDVMVLDLKMPNLDGMQVLRRVKQTYPEVEIIILTGYGSEFNKTDALLLGAFEFMEKPVNIERLIQIIQNAYKHKIQKSRRPTA